MNAPISSARLALVLLAALSPIFTAHAQTSRLTGVDQPKAQRAGEPSRAVAFTPSSAATDFTVVIDSTSSGYRGFGAFPTINDDGAVAFSAEPTPGVANTYKIEPGAAPLFIAEASTGAPSINNLGEAASRRLLNSGIAQFYKGTGNGMLSIIAQTGGADGTFRIFTGYVYLADTGVAVFSAELNPINPRRRGIYTGNGNGSTQVVVDNTGQFSLFGADPTLNNSGTVAFTGSLVNTENGLYLGTVGGNGVTTTILTAAATPLFAFDGSPFINDHGQIAFRANEDATSQSGIFTVNQDGTALRTIASAGNGPFSQFRAPTINDLGTVAFYGFTDAGGTGIFIGGDPVADKVVAVGDPLFGSAVSGLGFFRGLNNRNEIVFNYTLDDGREGIARAQLTPPATPTRVVSRKTHGAAGPFDLDLPLSGTPAVEGRSGGPTNDYQIVFTFLNPVTFTGATVSAAPGRSATMAGPAFSSPDGREVTVNLTNVDTGQTLTVTLTGVNNTTDLIVPLTVLMGDVNGNGAVTSSDVSQVKASVGAAVTQANFRADVTVNGTINSSDVGAVKAASGAAPTATSER